MLEFLPKNFKTINHKNVSNQRAIIIYIYIIGQKLANNVKHAKYLRIRRCSNTIKKKYRE